MGQVNESTKPTAVPAGAFSLSRSITFQTRRPNRPSDVEPDVCGFDGPKPAVATWSQREALGLLADAHGARRLTRC